MLVPSGGQQGIQFIVRPQQQVLTLQPGTTTIGAQANNGKPIVRYVSQMPQVAQVKSGYIYIYILRSLTIHTYHHLLIIYISFFLDPRIWSPANPNAQWSRLGCCPISACNNFDNVFGTI